MKAGGSVTLKSCGTKVTKAVVMSGGMIMPVGSKTLCLTAGPTSTPGGGGSPVHLKRTLTWETCAAATADRQTWRVQS